MRSTLAGLAVFALMGCGGSDHATAPPVTAMSMAISNPTPASGSVAISSGQSVYQCPFAFTATASGGSVGDFASWDTAEIDWRLTSNGALTTTYLGPTDLQDWWGADRVKAGSTAVAARSLNWSGPFTAVVVFRFTIFSSLNPFGESHSINVPVICS